MDDEVGRRRANTGRRLAGALPRPDLGSLRWPVFRRYLLAATITSASSWSLMTGLGWAILASTGSAAAVTLVQTAMLLPIPVAAIPAGILVDRRGPRGLVVATLLGLAAVTALLVLLAATDRLVLAAVLPLALVFGAFDGSYVVPAQVLVGRSVPAASMASAIALSALPVGVGRLVGGPLGGTLVERGGPVTAMAIGAAGLALAALILIGLPRLPGLDARTGRLEGLGDGLRFARRSPPTRAVVLLGVAVAALVYPYLALLPVVAQDLLRAGPGELGLLTAAGGVGALAAAFGTHALAERVGRGRLAILLVAVAGAALLVLGLAPAPAVRGAVAVLAMATIGFGTTATVLLQRIAPPRLRGRVLAVHGFAFYAAMPAGMLAAGLAVDAAGIATVLVALGLVAGLVAAVAWAASPSLRTLDLPG